MGEYISEAPVCECTDPYTQEARVPKDRKTEEELIEIMSSKTECFEIESEGLFWLIKADIPFDM